jgi:UDP-glucose:(heptosyl)LPS alpha-1,3-glucosyltransferase
MHNRSEPRLRVAILSRTAKATGGGAEKYTLALIEHLSEKHEIHVFAQKIEHQWPNVTYHRIPQAFEKPRWINQLWFALATWWSTREKFDIVHSHEMTWHANIQTIHVVPLKANLFRNRKKIFVLFSYFKIISSLRLQCYLWLDRQRYRYRLNKKIIATSTSLMQLVLENYPKTKSMLEVIVPGIESVRGVTTAIDKQNARKKLNLPAQGACILFVANDWHKKGLQTLLDAMQIIPENVFLAIAGNQDQIVFFKSIIKKYDIEDKVYFLGSIAHIAQAYMAADCIAHPTREDTFAMVVLEAMAHGLPAIVSSEKYCGISAGLEHQKNALILNNPENAAELAKLIEQVLTDNALRTRLTENGLKFSESHQWSALAKKQNDLYLEVAGVNKNQIL